VCDGPQKADCVRSLRLCVLGLLSGSIVQQNADMGLTKQLLLEQEQASHHGLAGKIIAQNARQQPSAAAAMARSSSFSSSYKMPLTRSRAPIFGSPTSTGGGNNNGSVAFTGDGAGTARRLGGGAGASAYEFLTGSTGF
jgi:hypothetical protein